MKWLVMGVLVLLALLFISGPASQDSRIEQEIWDFGHVALFAALSWLALHLPLLRTWPLWRVLLLCAVSAPLLGWVIEWLQLWVGRDFSYQDVLADTVGAFCGLAFYYLQRPGPVPVRTGWFACLAGLLAFALSHLAIVMADHYYMRRDFPVLADFETPFELARWNTHLAHLQVSAEQARHGDNSLRVTFLAGEYPDIALYDFPFDWREFKSVRVSVFNTLNLPTQIVLKIHDGQHVLNGYGYADRFNRELIVVPGWNDLVISLDDVIHAPADRIMNIDDIVNFSLFVKQLDAPVVMYLDGLYLSSK